jgi:beta-phosphoglucomutase-like phosphatase (HAD superfamily)
MVEALLLEWEGVLIDTRVGRCDALVRAFAAEGVALSASVCEACGHGRSVRDAAAAALLHAGLTDHTLAELVAMRAERSFLAELSRGIVLTPGAAAFVEQAQRHVRIGLATRAGRAETDILLRLSGLEAAIATVATADDVSGEAPSPALYRRAVAQLGRVRAVGPPGAVVLGDAPPSFRAAREAGLRTLAVGAPAHDAMEADAGVGSLDGLTVAMVQRLVAPVGAEPRA